MTALVQLAGAIAHELNNIFTAVAGNLSLIEEDIDRGSSQAEMIGEVVRTARRGIALSEKLQAFAGRQPLKRRRIDLSATLRELAAELRAALPNEVRLECRFTEGPWPAFADERKLGDCIRELAANAVAAMDGAGVLQFDVFTRHFAPGETRELRSGPYVGIRLTDTGRGMQPEVAARALDPMFSTRGTSIHVGWGLSNCSGFLRQSGGGLHVKSQPGRGTIVEAYLPLEPQAAAGSRHVA